MAAKTDPINTLNPAGKSDPKQGDNYIRTLAEALIELLTVDHYVGVANPWGSDASGDETGEHKKVTFHAPLTTAPTTSATQQAPFTSGMDSGAAELFVRPLDDGTPIQITSGGEVLFASLCDIAHDTYLKGVDAAGTGTTDLIKAGTGDVPVILAGAELSTSGEAATAAGIVCKEHMESAIGAAAGALSGADDSEQEVDIGGLQLKTGKSSAVAGDGTLEIVFATETGSAFDNACWQVMTCPAGSSEAGAFSVYDITSTSFFVKNTYASARSCRWFAIGY